MSVCIREPLTADRTYYVRTDGSDSNNGLTNDPAGAFLTIQKAVDTVADQIDIRGVDVTIQVADGAYNAPVNLRPYVGRTVAAGGVTLRGNPSTPTNVTIDVSVDCISAFETTIWMIEGFSLSTTGTYCVSVNNCRISLGGMDYRAAGDAHVRAVSRGFIGLLASYSIRGSAAKHLASDILSCVFVGSGVTAALIGTPAFSTSFVYTSVVSAVYFGSATFTGTCTGTRYFAVANSVIQTNGQGPNFIPGNNAGSTTTGGQYV